MLLFCNIGWMERYQGLLSGDEIRGGGAFVEREGHGHEVCNFTPIRGTLYGYVQCPGHELDIERLGAKPNAEYIDGLTVVWTATRPTGGTAVVGWYRNARVFRRYQRHLKAPVPQKDHGIDGFWILGSSANAKLLSVDERTCEIPRQIEGGIGQSNIWYADNPKSVHVLKRVNALISGKSASRAIGRKWPRSTHDQERKVRIEKAAINACCRHYESLGYVVTSVERDNRGWDLEAASGKTVLRIEVKGLSGREFSIELTPNEYIAFNSQAGDYRLAVVVDALGKPRLTICRYSHEAQGWEIEAQRNRMLEIKVRESATIRCS